LGQEVSCKRERIFTQGKDIFHAKEKYSRGTACGERVEEVLYKRKKKKVSSMKGSEVSFMRGGERSAFFSEDQFLSSGREEGEENVC